MEFGNVRGLRHHDQLPREVRRSASRNARQHAARSPAPERVNGNRLAGDGGSRVHGREESQKTNVIDRL